MFECVYDKDLLVQDVEAIVCPANRRPDVQGGLDRVIYKKAGKEKMQAARTAIGELEVSECAITDGFDLGVKVIHVVTPSYSVKDSEFLLYKCYKNVMELAKKEGIKSIAFPLLSSGKMKFPVRIASEIAKKTLLEYNGDFEKIILICQSEKSSLVDRIIDTDYTSIDREMLIELNSVADYECKDQAEHIHHMFDAMRKDEAALEEYQKERQRYLAHEYLDPNGYDMNVFRQYIDNGIGKGKPYKSLNNLIKAINNTESFSGGNNIDKVYRGERSCSKNIAIDLALALKLDRKDTIRFMASAAIKFPGDLLDTTILTCIDDKEYDPKVIRGEHNKAKKEKKRREKEER